MGQAHRRGRNQAAPSQIGRVKAQRLATAKRIACFCAARPTDGTGRLTYNRKLPRRGPEILAAARVLPAVDAGAKVESPRAGRDPQFAVGHVPVDDDVAARAFDREHAVVLRPVDLVAVGSVERIADRVQDAPGQGGECAFVLHRGSLRARVRLPRVRSECRLQRLDGTALHRRHHHRRGVRRSGLRHQGPVEAAPREDRAGAHRIASGRGSAVDAAAQGA